MSGVRRVKLGEVAELKYGKALPEHSRVHGDIAVFGSNGKVGTHTLALTNGETIIIGRKGSVGEVNYSPSSCWPIDTTYFVDSTSSEEHLPWLWRALAALNLQSLNKATGVPGLNRSDAYEKLLYLPPLEEQRRIAAILDQADTIRRQRRAALERLEELKGALFPAFCGSAERCSFGNLLEIPLRNGVSPATNGSHEGLVLTLSAVTGESFNINSYKAGMFANAIPVEKRVDRRDLLICRGNGNKNLVGRGFFPTEDMPDVAFPDTIIAARVDSTRLVPEFIEAVWNMPETRKQIEQSARTTNGTFKINQEMLEAVEVSIPPLSLQQAFAERVRAIEALKEQHRAHLAQLDTLFASLQHRAFSGEL
ncbi:restriction endonuclease subunit S [Asticcacaulis sp.]|uniref:restriction endonuclease subunit S n=1 Tax=Asticcacaulis sp. TaxID=1872648 RepID=UPI002601941B|nr:restriction endonuclease subunit S [Asticcacaulis sp.]